MGRDRRRAAGLARPGLADVRPHPAQGGRSASPARSSRCAPKRGRSKACSACCRQRIDENHGALRTISRPIDGARRRGRDAARRGHARTRRAARSGSPRTAQALDRAAEAARVDIGVLLEDLPRAEASARRWPSAARPPAATAVGQAAAFEAQVGSADRADPRGRRDRSPRRRSGWSRTDRDRQRRRRRAGRVDEAERGVRLRRSTPCCSARPRRSTKFAAGSTCRRRRSRRWSSRPRPGSAAPGSKRPTRWAAPRRRPSVARRADRAGRRAGARVAADDRRDRHGLAALDERFAALAGDGDDRAVGDQRVADAGARRTRCARRPVGHAAKARWRRWPSGRRRCASRSTG